MSAYSKDVAQWEREMQTSMRVPERESALEEPVSSDQNEPVGFMASEVQEFQRGLEAMEKARQSAESAVPKVEEKTEVKVETAPMGFMQDEVREFEEMQAKIRSPVSSYMSRMGGNYDSSSESSSDEEDMPSSGYMASEVKQFMTENNMSAKPCGC